MRVFVDTSGWVALFNKKDQWHRHASKLWGQLIQDRALIFTSDYVFNETVSLVRRRVSFEDAVRCGDHLLASAIVRMIEVTTADLTAAWNLYKQAGTKELSFTDCTSVSVMQSHKIEVALTFHHELQSAGVKIL